MSEIIFSSSYDEKHPPENIFDGSKQKFFSSTGIFPQEICIQFDNPKEINYCDLFFIWIALYIEKN